MGASYLAGRGFTRLAGAPLDASAESAGRDARLASVDGRLDVELVASDDWVDLADGRAKLFDVPAPGAGAREPANDAASRAASTGAGDESDPRRKIASFLH